MTRQKLVFTVVFVKLPGEYIAFIEELPDMSSRGRTISEARSALVRLANEVFAAERRSVDQAFIGKDMVRESLAISMS